MVDTMSRCPDRKPHGSRIAEKANAWGNAQDMRALGTMIWKEEV